MELQKNFLSNFLEYQEEQYFKQYKPKYRTVENFRSFLTEMTTRGLRTDNWNTGGNWRNCWGDDHEISAESPEDFRKNDLQFLKNYYSDFNVHSNDFVNACVVYDDSSSDYYGGTAYFSYKTLSLKDLQALLIKKSVESVSENLNVDQAIEERVQDKMEVLVKANKTKKICY